MNIKMKGLEDRIINDMEKAMDERGFCTQEYNTRSIIQAMEETNKKLLADVIDTTTTTTRNMTTGIRQQMNYLTFVEEDSYQVDKIAVTDEEKRVRGSMKYLWEMSKKENSL